MEKQHTPGPWTVIGNQKVAAVYAGPRRRTFICEIWHWPDALLIAAAPELLASVVELLSAMETHRIPGTKRVCARARRAVAKASGAPIRP